MASPGNFELTIMQILREVADSQRLPQKFKTRMRNFLEENDVTPIEKFMKIFGEEPREEESYSFMISNSGEQTPGNSLSEVNQSGIFPRSECFRSSSSKQTPTNSEIVSNNGSSISMIEAHKKIYKSGKMVNLGRTIFMSNPIRHRLQK
jgi:hypothetical protein